MIIELFRAIEEIPITLIQRKCCIFICKFVSKMKDMEIIEDNMDVLMNIIMFELRNSMEIKYILYSINDLLDLK